MVTMNNLVKQVIVELRKRKADYLETTFKKFTATVAEQRKNPPISPVNILEEYEREVSEERLKTGTLLDDLMGGGLRPRSSLLLYGEYASGKSQACYTMAVKCKGTVILIDVEGTASLKRLKQIADANGISFDEWSKKLILYRPKNWIDQVLLLDYLPSPADVDVPIQLVICDSLTKELRGIEFAGRENLTTKQPILREFIFWLEKIVDSYGAALIYTSQIYDNPDAGTSFLPDWYNQKLAGGRSLEHQPDYVVFLRKQKETANVRIARLMDASDVAVQERPFMIGGGGIMDLPESVRTEKLMEKTGKYGDKYYTSLDETDKERKAREKKEKEEQQ